MPAGQQRQPCLIVWGKMLIQATLQVCFCFTQSVASTRWMIQDELRVQNTQCDNCLIGDYLTKLLSHSTAAST